MASVRLYPAIFCLLLATACDEKSPAAPTVPLNERFTLAPGGRAAVDDAGFVVEFQGVTNDSRCPGDAICIQGGDAIVQVRVIDSGDARYELHTGDLSRTSIVHRDARIELVELQPYPFSNLPPIAPGDYRATLTVTRP